MASNAWTVAFAPCRCPYIAQVQLSVAGQIKVIDLLTRLQLHAAKQLHRPIGVDVLYQLGIAELVAVLQNLKGDAALYSEPRLASQATQ